MNVKLSKIVSDFAQSKNQFCWFHLIPWDFQTFNEWSRNPRKIVESLSESVFLQDQNAPLRNVGGGSIMIFWNDPKSCTPTIPVKNRVNLFLRWSTLDTRNLNLTLLIGRVQCACTFFKRQFLHEKKGLEVQNFLTFPDSLLTFRKSNKEFWFFSLFWVI